MVRRVGYLDGAPDFTSGMFVARVQGESMEPLIPSDSYCLFRPPPAGSRQGRRLLVAHDSIADPDTGGEFTVKVFASESVLQRTVVGRIPVSCSPPSTQRLNPSSCPWKMRVT